MSQEPIASSQSLIRAANNPFAGATYPFRALRLFASQPQYRVYVLMPIAINVLLGITIYAGLLFGGLRAIDAIIADLPTWTANTAHWSSAHAPAVDLGWHLPAWMSFPTESIALPDWFSNLLNWRPTLPDWLAAVPHWIGVILIWLLRVVLTIVLLFVTGFIFLQFGVLLGSPWYGKLSEELEKMRTGQLTLVEVGAVQDVWRAIAYELKKLVLGLGLGIPLLLLGLFPGVGTLLGSVGGIIVTTLLVCLDFLDAPLERRRLRFRQKLGVIWRSLPASGGFGLVCFGLASVPLLNLLAIPICVAAGTLFVCDYVLPWLPTPKPD